MQGVATRQGFSLLGTAAGSGRPHRPWVPGPRGSRQGARGQAPGRNNPAAADAGLSPRLCRYAARNDASRWPRLVIALIAGAPDSITAGSAGAQTPQQVHDVVEQTIQRLDLQTAFPRGEEALRWHFHLPPEMFWVVVAIAVAILLYLLGDMTAFLRAGSRAWRQEEPAPGANRVADEIKSLEQADELAAAGRFMEAMHVLLLQGLAHMRHRLGQQFSDSLTSREILRSTHLSQAARLALGDVVGRVERTYFGKQPAGLADYMACRESFHTLTQSRYPEAEAGA